MLGINQSHPHEPVPQAVPTSKLSFRYEKRSSTPEEKIRSFEICFAGGKMFSPFGGKERVANLAIHLPALWTGVPSMSRDQKSERRLPENQNAPATDDDAIRNHLTGKQTIGIYPLLPDDTCWFLAVDFDKKSWGIDAAAFAATCRRFQVPWLSSGRDQEMALMYGSSLTVLCPLPMREDWDVPLLTRTMENRHEIGLDSYDRLSQPGHHAQRCFGNLIALPLQKHPREQGNSVFLDELFPAAPRSVELFGVRSENANRSARSNNFRDSPRGKSNRSAPPFA